MGINLGELLKTAGAGFAGYGEDKQQILAERMAAETARRQAVKDAIDAKIAERTLRTPVLGDPLYLAAQRDLKKVDTDAAVQQATALSPIKVKEAVDQATALSPIKVSEAVETAKGTAPVQQATHAANRDYDNANPAAVKDAFTFPVGAGPDGKPIVLRGNTKTGEIEATNVAAKQSAAMAKLTEAQEKSYLFRNLMRNAEPDIDRTIAGGKIRPAALTAYLNSGPADIGINALLNEDEQVLMRAARDFTAGVLRKESGAAVTHGEIKQTLDRFFPGFGDKGPVGASKTAARKAYMQTMDDEAMPADEFYRMKKGTPSGDVPQPAVPTFEEWRKNRKPPGAP